jgi:protein O-GlcNAc transferase
VLRALPASRLLVFHSQFLTFGTRAPFARQFAGRGIPAGRVLFGHTPAEGDSFLGVYRGVDVLLDVFPWSGHTTACDALWMGVPALTLRGNRHAGRMVASVLTQLGLADLIADTPEDFVARAVGLAGDLDRLRSLRSGLRERMRASLCDGRAFTRGLEGAYREMWVRWVRGTAA